MKRMALRGVARDRAVSGGSGGIENRVGLLVTIGARLALEPVDVAAGIEHHVQGLGRGADADAREVLAASLAHTRHDRGGEVLGSDLGVHGFEIGLLDVLNHQLELGVERVDSGGVATESGLD